MHDFDIGVLPVRKFDTGATRDSADGKIDPEGCMSPLVVKAFCEYLNRCRIQADGSLRDSDNWQKGMPYDQYLKSAFRHFLEVWTISRGGDPVDDRVDPVEVLCEALCALKFNINGMLYELLKGRGPL